MFALQLLYIYLNRPFLKKIEHNVPEIIPENWEVNKEMEWQQRFFLWRHKWSGTTCTRPPPLPWPARTRQTPDCIWRKNVGPYVHIGQGPLEGLIGVKASSNWILFLPQHHRTSSSNGVSCSMSCGVHTPNSIFVELPFATTALPRHTNVVPSSVISWLMCFPEAVKKREVRKTGFQEFNSK